MVTTANKHSYQLRSHGMTVTADKSCAILIVSQNGVQCTVCNRAKMNSTCIKNSYMNGVQCTGPNISLLFLKLQGIMCSVCVVSTDSLAYEASIN